MELDRQYLLSVDPERLLHNFRVNAALASSAAPYGGWEAPDCELRGHFAGHYLSACSRLYLVTRDDALRSRTLYLVRELARCQQANGYLSAFPVSLIDRVEKGERVWAPYYTLHKLFAGLQDAWQFLASLEALDTVCGMADWLDTRCSLLSDAQMQTMLACEHGGMNETLANLFKLTDNRRYLELSLRFNHAAVIEPLLRKEDQLDGLHANTQIPKLIGTAVQYEITGRQPLLEASRYFWEQVVTKRSYANGGNSDCERFTPLGKLSQHLSPETSETCNTYNMLKLSMHLFDQSPDEKYTSYAERALFNHILPSQHPDSGMMCYYFPLRPNSHKVYNTPFDSFWCCTGTGVENHSRTADYIYSWSGRSEGGQCSRIFVNQFVASELYFESLGVTIRQETKFPLNPSINLFVGCEANTAFELCIRRPRWAGQYFDISINGSAVAVREVRELLTSDYDQGECVALPDGYVSIQRSWGVGDRVEVKFSMETRIERFADNPSRIAFMYGPVLLCARSQSSLEDVAVVGSGPFELQLIPVTQTGDNNLKFRTASSMFRSAGTGEPVDVEFVPLSSVRDERYGVYFDTFDEPAWKAHVLECCCRNTVEREIAERTLDRVYLNHDLDEQRHQLSSRNSYSGDFGDWSYRDARDGGYFSCELTSLADIDLELLVSYWGSDFGRTFDLLVDDQVIATETLSGQAPDRLYDAIYPLDRSLTSGKTMLKVTVQAPARGMAGPVFGIRLLRTAAHHGERERK